MASMGELDPFPDPFLDLYRGSHLCRGRGRVPMAAAAVRTQTHLFRGHEARYRGTQRQDAGRESRRVVG